ncbi:MAG: type III-B CRISPR module-associated Cmr3 family protein [Thermoproteota archaeon]
MTQIGCILFEPTGPLMFRGPMEFTPVVRGPQTLARTLPLPLPSTVAGCLATLLIDKGLSNPPKEVANWDNALKQVLGLSEEAYLRGPYLLVEEKVYVPFGDGVIELDKLVRALKGISVKRLICEGKPLADLIKSIPLKKIEHVGIGLRRTAKAVERGLLYSAEFIDLISTFHGRKVYVAVDIHGETALNKLSSAEQYVMRLGGEGRVVRIHLRERSYLWEEVKEIIERIEPSEKLLYLISPSLLRTPLTHLTPITSTKTPKFSINGFELELLTGRIDILGTGFDIRLGIRKPMYASLTPGSLITARFKDNSLVKLYELGTSNLGGRLGYGTFIPVANF